MAGIIIKYYIIGIGIVKSISHRPSGKGKRLINLF